MFNQNYLLVADKLFIRLQCPQTYTTVNIFPGENIDCAYRASYEDLLSRGYLESEFFNKMIPQLARDFSELFNMPSSYLEILIRPVFVNLCSIYIDRAICVAHRVMQLQEHSITVANVKSSHSFKTLDSIRSLESSDFHFNQKLIERISTILGISDVYKLHPSEYSETINHTSQRNLLFKPVAESFAHKTIISISNYIFKILKLWQNPYAIYTSLGFSGDDFWLARKGFYGPLGIFNSKAKFDWSDVSRDEMLRDDLEKIICNTFGTALTDLISKITRESFSNATYNQLGKAFPRYFADYIPLCYLEGLKSNLNTALKVRKNQRNNLLIGTDMNHDMALFLITATKILGGQSVGVQHGGNYGYIEALSYISENEIPIVDMFATWGWMEHDIPSIKFIPLPSPRLSSRPISKYRLNPIKKRYDIIFLPNFLRRFPPVGCTGRTRPDFNQRILASQKALVSKIVKAKISIHLKPYTMKMVDYFKEHYDALDEIGKLNGRYRLVESKQKGLSSNLISNYSLLLWDNLGTGALDCFVHGLPTMIYWERIYCRESSYARGLISELEDVGIIHRCTTSLIPEILNFLEDPMLWMADQKRKSAIESFCNSYARTDLRWHEKWDETLRSLRGANPIRWTK